MYIVCCIVKWSKTFSLLRYCLGLQWCCAWFNFLLTSMYLRYLALILNKLLLLTMQSVNLLNMFTMCSLSIIFIICSSYRMVAGSRRKGSRCHVCRLRNIGCRWRSRAKILVLLVLVIVMMMFTIMVILLNTTAQFVKRLLNLFLKCLHFTYKVEVLISEM